MADLHSRDRLQPSLLDRLTDHYPLESHEAIEARVLSRQELRAAVLRDLTWLFNATRAQPESTSTRSEELALWARVPHACRSVLNFGLPAFSGRTKSSLNKLVMENALKQAITTFEPRIDPTSLELSIRIESSSHHNTMQVTIRGRLWSQPVPLEMLLLADVDLETGSTAVRDMRS